MTGEPTVEIQPKPLTTKGPAETFTGDVWVDLIAQDEPRRGCGWGLSGSLLARIRPGTDMPTARRCTSLERRGLVQSRGGQVLQVSPGDTIVTPPAEWHWHGAAPEQFHDPPRPF